MPLAIAFAFPSFSVEVEAQNVEFRDFEIRYKKIINALGVKASFLLLIGESQVRLSILRNKFISVLVFLKFLVLQ